MLSDGCVFAGTTLEVTSSPPVVVLTLDVIFSLPRNDLPVVALTLEVTFFPPGNVSPVVALTSEVTFSPPVYEYCIVDMHITYSNFVAGYD